MDLTDEQWAILRALIPEPRSMRRWSGAAMEGDASGSQWHPLGSAHRGAVARFTRQAEDLQRRGKLYITECFIDGTFVGAKKGGSVWAKPSGAKARNS